MMSFSFFLTHGLIGKQFPLNFGHDASWYERAADIRGDRNVSSSIWGNEDTKSHESFSEVLWWYLLPLSVRCLFFSVYWGEELKVFLGASCCAAITPHLSKYSLPSQHQWCCLYKKNFDLICVDHLRTKLFYFSCYSSDWSHTSGSFNWFFIVT